MPPLPLCFVNTGPSKVPVKITLKTDLDILKSLLRGTPGVTAFLSRFRHITALPMHALTNIYPECLCGSLCTETN